MWYHLLGRRYGLLFFLVAPPSRGALPFSPTTSSTIWLTRLIHPGRRSSISRASLKTLSGIARMG